MPRILLIAPPSFHFQKLKENLIKIGFFITVISEEAETFDLIHSTPFDAYILEPFSNFKMAAKILRQLNELNYFSKCLLALPGVRPHEESTAKKIVKDNYFSINGPMEKIEQKINFLCTQNITDKANHIKISSPIIQHVKNEIEKAKKGKTELSFLYIRTKSNNLHQEDFLLSTINSIAPDRIKISNEALPFKEGLLILLLGTSKNDCLQFKKDFLEKITSSLPKENLNSFSDFECITATYPQDGTSYLEITQSLEAIDLEQQNYNNVTLNISTIAKHAEHFSQTFRPKRNSGGLPPIELNNYIPVNYLPPTWVGAFYQHENDPHQLYQYFQENAPTLIERITAIAQGLIHCFPQYNKISLQGKSNPFQDIISVFEIDEFKNICMFSLLENIFNNIPLQCSDLFPLSYLQTSVALELSKTLDYPKKTELLLCAFSQNLSNILINIRIPEHYQTIAKKNRTTNSSIGQLYFENHGFTPSELIKIFLKQWNVEEQIVESAACVRHEFIPKLNPQLTAITHLAVVISNLINKLNPEKNLNLSQMAVDEIGLRNRSLKLDSLNYMLREPKQWQNNYSFLNPTI